MLSQLITIISLKYQHQLGMKHLIYLMDRIIYQKYKIILNIIKKHETIAENAPILIYTNTINKRIVFKLKSGYKLELLSKETMKLLGSTKDIIDADKNSENVPKLENVEVVLVHCNLVNNAYQQHSRVLFTFVPTKQYDQLISISPHSLVFLKTMNTDFSEIEV